MFGDNSVKLLWLSDIHFFKKYESFPQKNELENYIEKFIRHTKDSHTAEAPFDYILVSGDLAQQGTTADYETFFSMLLGPLLDLFLKGEKERSIPIPKLLTIPGNHDVNWDNTHFLTEYLDRLKITKGHEARIAFLDKKITVFKSLFAEYSNFATKYIKTIEKGKYAGFIDDISSDNLILSSEYRTSRLFGYIIDRKKKIVFILLNSAWYSLGTKFNNLLSAQKIFNPRFVNSIKRFIKWQSQYKDRFKKSAKYYLGKGEKTNDIIDFGNKKVPGAVSDIYSYISDTLNIKDDIAEYNKQVSGINLLDVDALERDIRIRFSDFFVLTTMHHPFNWMEWEEQYSYYEHTKGNANRFRKLMSLTNLFLTGHEHVPERVSQEKFFENTMHLKAGCFLFDKQHEQTIFANSWFSILRIDSDSKLFEQEKVLYDNDSENWTPVFNNREYLVKGKFHLTSGKRKMVLDMLNGNINDRLKKYLIAKKIIPAGQNILINLIATFGNYLDIIEVAYQGKIELVIIAKNTNFYNSVCKEKVLNNFDRLVKQYKKKMTLIRFFVLDLFVDAKLAKLYSSDKISREDIRDLIFKRGDILFDSFRHTFFVRFEKSLKSNKKLPSEFYHYYNNLRFVNHLIPYWDFEKYWV